MRDELVYCAAAVNGILLLGVKIVKGPTSEKDRALQEKKWMNSSQ